jgi:hypothetical protein
MGALRDWAKGPETGVENLLFNTVLAKTFTNTMHPFWSYERAYITKVSYTFNLLKPNGNFTYHQV